MKKYIIIVVVAALQMVAVGQTVNVHFKNGQIIQYPSSNVDYVDFSEKTAAPTVSAGQVVDLGLSVYWASCNVGAEKPEEYGDFYAWGETKPKSSYYTKNYSFYNAELDQIINIGEDISRTEYDAATMKLGTDWRMPTNAEMQELIDNCAWEWIVVSGVRGYKVTAKNGNSIFLPAAGFKSDTQHYDNNTGLYYPSSVQSILTSCYYLSGNSSSHRISSNDKYIGYAIRPVTTNPNASENQVDHSQDHLVTDKVTAAFLGGAYSSINGKIQGGSQLNVKFSNGSSESVILTKIQLNDGSNGTEGNNLLDTEVEVAAGDSKSYTVTVGYAGISTPVICFTYRYNKKNYTTEATMNF